MARRSKLGTFKADFSLFSYLEFLQLRLSYPWPSIFYADHILHILVLLGWTCRWTWRSCARRTSSTRCRRSPPPTRPSLCSSSPRSTGGKNYQFMHWRLPVNLQKGWFVLEATSNLSKKPLNKLIHTKRCFQETSRYILSFFTFALTRTCLFLNCLSDPKENNQTRAIPD